MKETSMDTHGLVLGNTYLSFELNAIPLCLLNRKRTLVLQEAIKLVSNFIFPVHNWIDKRWRYTDKQMRDLRESPFRRLEASWK